MKKSLRILAAVAVAALVPTLAFAAPKLSAIAAQNKGKTMAVISLSANNYGGSLQGWNSADTYELMGSRLNTMLELTEEILAKDWTMLRVADFMSNADYQALAVSEQEVAVPILGDASMPLFCKDRKELIKATASAEVIKQIAEAIGADYVTIIYAEWSVATGYMVPTSKAVSKNVVAVYDNTGKQVFTGRSDDKGTKTLGTMGRVAVNEDTIDQWVDAYERGIAKLFKEGRK